MDLVWLVIPAALGLFALRTWWVARRLRLAARIPMSSDLRALREAQESLRAHREHLGAARAAPEQHLAEAKGMSRFSAPRVRAPSTGVDAMVEDYLPERRL